MSVAFGTFLDALPQPYQAVHVATPRKSASLTI